MRCGRCGKLADDGSTIAVTAGRAVGPAWRRAGYPWPNCRLCPRCRSGLSSFLEESPIHARSEPSGPVERAELPEEATVPTATPSMHTPRWLRMANGE
jgi:hypothetical protein